jgi:hypothetical protein
VKQWNSGVVNLMRTLLSKILRWEIRAVSHYKHPGMLLLNPLGRSKCVS